MLQVVCSRNPDGNSRYAHDFCQELVECHHEQTWFKPWDGPNMLIISQIGFKLGDNFYNAGKMSTTGARFSTFFWEF